MPSQARDQKGYDASQRQVYAWKASDPKVAVHTRPRNYRDPTSPREKGVDVQLAVDFVAKAIHGEFDVGIICSDDTDLHPALEAVTELMHGKIRVELAGWRDTNGSPRIVNAGGIRVPTRLLDFTEYTRIRDTTD